MKLTSILYWLYQPFNYWYNFFLEFRIWFIFQTTTKRNRKKLEEQDLRVDWIGRVYGVVNVPDEVLGAAEEIQQAYVLKQLGQFGGVMNELKISNVVYPQIQEIPGSGAYLVIFWPVLDRLNVFAIIGSLLYTLFYTFMVYLLIRLFVVYNIFGCLFDFIKDLL
tara:strand:- start:3077 stop:3568 length:492 start_codon:yes stop_codon:yes gene_type:complete